MKLKDIFSDQFQLAFASLIKNQIKNIKGQTVLKIKKLNNAFRKEYATFEEARLEIINSYCLKDENNKPIVKDKKYVYADSEDEDIVNEKINDLLNAHFNLPVKIDFAEIESLELEMKDLLILDEVISDSN